MGIITLYYHPSTNDNDTNGNKNSHGNSLCLRGRGCVYTLYKLTCFTLMTS